MKIYGVSVVQDEADVIRESVEWALRFCDRIWIWDLGSRDGTWEILQQFGSARVHVERREQLSYASSLRGEVFKAYRDQIEEGSWIYILDADEFLAGDPRPVLQAAEAEGAGLVGVWQANFFPTDLDWKRAGEMGLSAWCRIPLAERLRFYRVEWFEWRFVRVVSGLMWGAFGAYSDLRGPDGQRLRRSRRALVVRHYRYRTPEQVARRLALRRAAAGMGARFRYERAADFLDVIRPSSACRYWAAKQELRVPRWEMARARARAARVRARRWWERRRAFDSLDTRGEPPLFNFLVPASSDAELAELARKDVDRDWRLFRMGEYCWSLQTYLILKARGLPVSLSRKLRPDAVNLGHHTLLSRLRPDAGAFVVEMQADYRPLGWTACRVVQNRLQAKGGRTFWIPLWSQPGLIGRDPNRCGVKTAAYVGRSWMQAGTPEQWAEALRPLGVEFRLIHEAWNDLSDVDVLVAIRSFDGRIYPNKPPTKLINAWMAGIPLVGGCDSAFSQIGAEGGDYLVARTLEEAVDAIRRLKEDPDLYARIVSRGREKARLFTRDRLAERWAFFLRERVAPAYLRWKEAGRGARAVRRLRAGCAAASWRIRGFVAQTTA